MRVRLQPGGRGSALDAALPVAGRLLHPETNRAEWAIIALDHPLSVGGRPTELLCLRPTHAGRVGGPAPIPVHVAPVTSVRELGGRPVYDLGEVAGQAICAAEGEAEQAVAPDGAGQGGN